MLIITCFVLMLSLNDTQSLTKVDFIETYRKGLANLSFKDNQIVHSIINVEIDGKLSKSNSKKIVYERSLGIYNNKYFYMCKRKDSKADDETVLICRNNDTISFLQMSSKGQWVLGSTAPVAVGIDGKFNEIKLASARDALIRLHAKMPASGLSDHFGRETYDAIKTVSFDEFSNSIMADGNIQIKYSRIVNDPLQPNNGSSQLVSKTKVIMAIDSGGGNKRVTLCRYERDTSNADKTILNYYDEENEYKNGFVAKASQSLMNRRNNVLLFSIKMNSEYRFERWDDKYVDLNYYGVHFTKAPVGQVNYLFLLLPIAGVVCLILASFILYRRNKQAAV